VCFCVRNEVVCEECHFDSYNTYIEIKWIRVSYSNYAYYIACCYYPPKPRHTPDQFISQLRTDLDTIMANNDCCTVIVTGDFNKLNTIFLESDYGLTQCVRDVTHGSSILDKFFCSHLFVYRVAVHKSCLKTKHHAILAAGHQVKCKTNVRKKFVVFDLRDSNIDRLRYYLSACNWDKVYNCDDINIKYQNFVNILLILMSQCIPAKIVRLGKKEGSFLPSLTICYPIGTHSIK